MAAPAQSRLLTAWKAIVVEGDRDLIAPPEVGSNSRIRRSARGEVAPVGAGGPPEGLTFEHRNVNETGGLGSIVIRPPKKWARLVGVRPGDEVVVAFGHGSILFVAPSGKEAEIRRLVAAAGGSP